MKRLKRFLFLTGLATIGPALEAQTFCSAPQTQYLSVVETLSFWIPRSPVTREAQELRFIFTDGSQLRSDVFFETSSKLASLAGTLGRSLTPSGNLRERYLQLRQAAQAARIGIQESCYYARNLPPNFEMRITWFGKPPRRNTFAVSTTDSSLPACSPEIVSFVDSLHYYGEAPAELLSSPPS